MRESIDKSWLWWLNVKQSKQEERRKREREKRREIERLQLAKGSPGHVGRDVIKGVMRMPKTEEGRKQSIRLM